MTEQPTAPASATPLINPAPQRLSLPISIISQLVLFGLVFGSTLAVQEQLSWFSLTASGLFAATLSIFVRLVFMRRWRGGLLFHTLLALGGVVSTAGFAWFGSTLFPQQSNSMTKPLAAIVLYSVFIYPTFCLICLSITLMLLWFDRRDGYLDRGEMVLCLLDSLVYLAVAVFTGWIMMNLWTK